MKVSNLLRSGPDDQHLWEPTRMWIPRETVDAIGEGRGLWPYETDRVSYVSLQGYDPSRWPVGRRVDVAHPEDQNLVRDAACATGKRSVYIATDS